MGSNEDSTLKIKCNSKIYNESAHMASGIFNQIEIAPQIIREGR